MQGIKLFLILTSLVLAGKVRADSSITPLNDKYTVRCESESRWDYQTCDVVGEGFIVEAQVVQEFSESPCEYGVSWGYNLNNIWVTDGCKAEFLVTKDFRFVP